MSDRLLFFFLVKLVVFIFIAIIRSIILYKVNTYTKHVRLSYIFFFSSNVTSFYLFAPSSYFFFLTYIRSLSFSRSLSHSFIRCFPSVHVSTHLLPFLSLFLLFLARVFSTAKPETRRKLYARHASASTNRSWVPTLRRVCHSWQNSSS